MCTNPKGREGADWAWPERYRTDLVIYELNRVSLSWTDFGFLWNEIFKATWTSKWYNSFICRQNYVVFGMCMLWNVRKINVSQIFKIFHSSCSIENCVGYGSALFLLWGIFFSEIPDTLLRACIKWHLSQKNGPLARKRRKLNQQK